MDQDVKQKWVTALRSGEYQQTRGTLNRVRPWPAKGMTPGFCCLGVLVDVVHPDWWQEIDSSGCRVYINPRRFPVIWDAILDRDLMNEVDVDQSDLDVLMSMNDRGEPFLVIADWIEENL